MPVSLHQIHAQAIRLLCIPSEISLSDLSSLHRLLFCTLPTVNMKASGTMATGNWDVCKKGERLQFITPQLCLKTQIRQIRNLLEEFCACQHFLSTFFVPECECQLIHFKLFQTMLFGAVFLRKAMEYFERNITGSLIYFSQAEKFKKKKNTAIWRDLVLVNIILFALLAFS